MCANAITTVKNQVLFRNFIRFLFFCSHFSDFFRIFAFAIGKPTTQKTKNECKNKYLMAKIIVRNQTKKTLTKDGVDYICITDIARQKNPIEPKDVVKNWLRSKNTLEYLGLWEHLSPIRWVELTHAVVLLNFINYE